MAKLEKEMKIMKSRIYQEVEPWGEAIEKVARRGREGDALKMKYMRATAEAGQWREQHLHWANAAKIYRREALQGRSIPGERLLHMRREIIRRKNTGREPMMAHWKRQCHHYGHSMIIYSWWGSYSAESMPTNIYMKWYVRYNNNLEWKKWKASIA